MPNYRAQLEYRAVSGLAADSATNTLYCIADDAGAAQLFVNAVGAEIAEFSPYFSSPIVVATGGLRIKLYNMDEPEPRVPLSTTSFSLAPAGGTPLPTECALVCSYRADYGSGLIPARRRGRFYLPFLDESANGTDARPNSGVIGAAVKIMDDLGTASLAATTWKWAQYSPTSDEFDIVVAGWVDNEWDTQRRRGRRATSRTTWVI